MQGTGGHGGWEMDSGAWEMTTFPPQLLKYTYLEASEGP